MKPIRIALTKGRLESKTIDMLERLGYDCTNARKKGRKLIMPIGNGEIEVVLAKAADVVTYVESGVCDMGVVGKDTIMEKGGTFYEVADLGFGKCRFALAVVKGKNLYEGYHNLTIASKYVNVAKNFFEQKSMDVDIVKIEGSVELAPVLGLADAIVDIVAVSYTHLDVYKRQSLTRKFRETYHISIHDYICQVRLENGCRLLRGTSLSIGEIAFSCGYGDQNYFTRAFCRTYGMTPMQYRKKETI